MLKNRKRVFWEALLLTVVVFFFGILIGVAFESNRVSEINAYYAQSEVSLMDIFALNSMLDLDVSSCDILMDSNLEFADKIYEEAVLLEKYEDSGKVTQSMELVHKKYDILRTFLWINNIKLLEKCGKKYSTVVYIYEYQPEDLTQRAVQNVWSKILLDLKNEKGSDVLLIPIAVDSGLTSLNSLIDKFEISYFPAVIIDEKDVLYALNSMDDLKEVLE